MPKPFDNILVLGHSGLIGSRIESQLRLEHPEIPVHGRSIREADLTRVSEAGRLAGLLDPRTALVICSGIKPQVADDLGAFEQNIGMLVNLCRLLDAHPVARTLYLSSAAVYGEETHDLAISEKTPVQPASYYGIAKHASELLLRRTVRGSLVLMRPPLVYGPGDSSNSYGPGLFAAAGVRRETVRLWGEGEELREFLFVDDAARLACRLLFHDFDGVINAAGGKSHSFREVLELLGGLLGSPIRAEFRARTKRKADCGFDAGLLRGLLPDFRFTDLKDGLAATLDSARARSLGSL